MAAKYFELEDDINRPGRWFLNGLTDNAGRGLDDRDFTYGLPIELGPPMKLSLSNETTIVDVDLPLRVSKQRDGTPLDFTFAGLGMPVVTTRVAELLAAVAGSEIQRVPIRIESQTERYEIINLTSRMSCIDPNRSIIEWWTAADGRPDKVGKPRMITKLVIDPTSVRDSHVFRIEGWASCAVVVSETVRGALEKAHVSGVKFRNEGDGTLLFDLLAQKE